jgi:hypothetical protein
MSRSLSMRRRSVGMHRVPGEFGIHLRTSSTPPSDIHRASDDILERSLHPTVSEQVGHDFRIDTRLQRYCEPLRHPTAPDLSLAGVRLIIADHALGLTVLRTLSLSTCRRQYPGAAAGLFFAHLTQPFQPSPIGQSGRPAHRPFRGLLSVHSRCGLHTRAATNS